MKSTEIILEFERKSNYEERLGKAMGILRGIGLSISGNTGNEAMEAADDITEVFLAIADTIRAIKQNEVVHFSKTSLN